ncbi:MAG: 6-bladed beta-propeller [Thermonemataceae bacterium]|nr:6-bladed beta-propeller [Thermonemataceae bacterium]
MKKIYKFLLLFLISSSCYRSIESSKSTFYINVSTDDIDGKIKYSDFLEDAKFIQLETKDSLNIIKEVDEVLIDKDKIFILDKFGFQGIMAFDTSGKHLFSLKAGGGSEGEFSHISGMGINRKNKELIVYSTPNLLYYSYNGKYLKKYKKLDFLGTNFETNGSINAFIGQDYGLVLTDTNFKVYLKQFDKSKIHKLNFLQPLQEISQGILFRHSLNDTIYLANSQGLSNFAIIDFQDKRLNKIDVEKIIKNDIRELPSGKMGRIKYFFDTKNIIYFAFEYNKMLYVAFYDKHNKKVKIIRGNSKEQNDVTLENTLPYVVGSYGGGEGLIAVIDVENTTTIDLKKIPITPITIKLLKSFHKKESVGGVLNPNIVLMKIK